MSIIKYRDDASSPWQTIDVMKGRDAIHVGPSAPTDPEIDMWLDTDEPGQTVVTSVNGMSGPVSLSVLDGGDAGISFQTASIGSNSSVTLNFGAGGTSTVVFVSGTSSDRMAMVYLLCTTAGVVHSSVLGSGVTVSQATANDYKAVITGGAGSRYLLVVNYRGVAPVIS